MPRSKRDKKISLTKTKKKGLEVKQRLIEDVRKCTNEYPNIFVFDVHNMRNSKLKLVRIHWKDSRFFFGKNKVMAFALGKLAQDEIKDNLHLLSAELKGQRGLLFTSREKKDVVKWFKEFEEKDFAKSGNIATETIELQQGPLPDFSHAIEPHLRQLGMPTSLIRGIVTLSKDFTVCKVGDVLTPEQARILKLLGRQLVSFKLKLRCYWSDGKFKEVKKSKKKSINKDVDMNQTDDTNIVEDVEMNDTC